MAFVKLGRNVRDDYGVRTPRSAEARALGPMGILDKDDIRQILDVTNAGSVQVLTTAGNTYYLPRFLAKKLEI